MANQVLKFEAIAKRQPTLFEMSLISAMPGDVYKEIKERMELVETYLEDGACITALSILKEFLHLGAVKVKEPKPAREGAQSCSDS